MLARQFCLHAPTNWSQTEKVINSGLIALKYHAPMLGLEPLPVLNANGNVFGGRFSLLTWLEFMRILNWLLIPLIVAVGVARIVPRYK